MLNENIGQVAGQVWRVLDERGPMKLPALQKQVPASSTVVHLALGWLAREDKVDIAPDGRTYQVKLR